MRGRKVLSVGDLADTAAFPQDAQQQTLRATVARCIKVAFSASSRRASDTGVDIVAHVKRSKSEHGLERLPSHSSRQQQDQDTGSSDSDSSVCADAGTVPARRRSRLALALPTLSQSTSRSHSVASPSMRSSLDGTSPHIQSQGSSSSSVSVSSITSGESSANAGNIVAQLLAPVNLVHRHTSFDAVASTTGALLSSPSSLALDSKFARATASLAASCHSIFPEGDAGESMLGPSGFGANSSNGGSGRTLLADLPGCQTPWACVNATARAAAAAAVTAAAQQDFRRAHSALPVFMDSGDLDPNSSGDDDLEEATRRIKAAFYSRAAPLYRHSSWHTTGTASSPLGVDGVDSSLLAGLPSERRSPQGQLCSAQDNIDSCHARPARNRSSYHLTNSHAAVELFLRLNHARQTLDFVKRQAATFALLDKAEMDIWEALATLNELREYEAALMGGEDATPEMSLLDHAFQTAELCRLRHPGDDWLHLVGLIHGLGKLLAHRKWGSQPQWAICGENYPVGCRFSSQLAGSEFFTANPDRRRRLLNTPCGMYQPHCGLTNVYMSWGASEYLYLVLALNDTQLPPEALFIVRHHKFKALAAGAAATSSSAASNAYTSLLSADDRRMVPLLAEFQELAAYRAVPLPDGALQGDERRTYYDGLITKYLGQGMLSW